jgi:hypothetical protein
MSYVNIPIGPIDKAKLRNCVRKGKLSLSMETVTGSSHTMSFHPSTATKIENAKKHKRGAHSLIIVPDEIKHSMEHHPGKSVWKEVWPYAEKQFAARGV